MSPLLRYGRRLTAAKSTLLRSTSVAHQQRCHLSSNNDKSSNNVIIHLPHHPQLKSPINPVYVHPLSQIVLQFFQKHCHHWICAKNLDGALTLHRDGTFMMQAPPSKNSTKAPRIWTYYDTMDKKHWLSYKLVDTSTEEEGSHPTAQRRFLLQDNLMPAWHGNRRKNLSERVQECVVDLIHQVDEDMALYERHFRRD